MMRRTVTLEVEIEGHQPDVYELRNAVRALSWRPRWSVVRSEIVSEADPRGC
jgi:hypothetical protein